MIGDPSGANQFWTDEDLQDALDHNRREARYGRLREVETILPNGSVQYLIFIAGFGDWEDGAALHDASFNAVAPSDSDLLTGRWTFSTMPNRPVYVVGWHYDLYGAAVEILESWMAWEKLSFDFSADQQGFKRSQKFDQLQQMADKYRRQQWVGFAPICQADFNAHAV